jgi:hypothetical protein
MEDFGLFYCQLVYVLLCGHLVYSWVIG